MHQMQNHFIQEMKKQHPEAFTGVKVLDIGSLDVNGNNRQFFEKSNYTGIDVIEGPNVDVVSPLHEWKTRRRFDTIISTSHLEHDMYIAQTIAKMYKLLKPGGWLFIVACRTWAKHGTKDNGPQNAGNSQIDKDGWSTYYQNVTRGMLNKHLEPFEFESSKTSVSPQKHKDVRFYGQKPGNRKIAKIIKDNLDEYKRPEHLPEAKPAVPKVPKKKAILWKYTDFSVEPGMSIWPDQPDDYKREYFLKKNLNWIAYKKLQKTIKKNARN